MPRRAVYKALLWVPVLVLALILGGCLSGSSNRGRSTDTVTLSGRVSTSNTQAAANAVQAQNDAESTSEIPVTVFRVLANGNLDVVTTGRTDSNGWYRFTGIPNRTQIIVEAELKNGVKMRSMAVTNGDTSVDITPVSHVSSEVVNRLIQRGAFIWKLEFTPAQLEHLITEGARLFQEQALPIVDPPPPVSEWNDRKECDLFGDGDGPTLPVIECYIDYLDWVFAQVPTLTEAANGLLLPYLPQVTLPRVANPIPVDGSRRGWEGIDPVVTNRGGSRRVNKVSYLQTITRYTDFRHLYMARDSNSLYVLIEYDTPAIETDWASLSLTFAHGFGRWDEALDVFFDFDGFTPQPEPRVWRGHESWNRGSELEGFAWSIQGPFVELKMPYAWITEKFGSDSFLVFLESHVTGLPECDPTVGCRSTEWWDTLPVVRIAHR